jgi:hypothetical protein
MNETKRLQATATRTPAIARLLALEISGILRGGGGVVVV